MLPVVSEKVAGEHCPEVIFFQGSCGVRLHLGCKWGLMRLVGAEVKELQHAPKTW